MKVRLLLALVAMAIGFNVPTFAQQSNTPDPQLRQVVDAFTQKIHRGMEQHRSHHLGRALHRRTRFL
jgi:hypothetical protein